MSHRKTENPVPSSANSPDLDWSQVRETVMLLGVTVAQIEGAMKDGDESVSVLADSFTTMYGDVRKISKDVEALSGDGEAFNVEKAIQDTCEAISAKMKEVIVAMQFYDKLTQRLSHVSNSLLALANLVGNSSRLYNPGEWIGLQEKIKAKYALEEDRLMFDAIINGKSIEQALAISAEFVKKKKGRKDNIELF